MGIGGWTVDWVCELEGWSVYNIYHGFFLFFLGQPHTTTMHTHTHKHKHPPTHLPLQHFPLPDAPLRGQRPCLRLLRLLGLLSGGGSGGGRLRERGVVAGVAAGVGDLCGVGLCLWV